MQIEKFEGLLNNNDVIKLNEGSIVLENLKEQIFIVFGFKYLITSITEKRISLIVYRKENLTEDLEADHYIKTDAIVLVNYLDPMYALSFKLTVNGFKKNVCISILDLPENGENRITAEECNGINFSYHKINSSTQVCL